MPVYDGPVPPEMGKPDLAPQHRWIEEHLQSTVRELRQDIAAVERDFAVSLFFASFSYDGGDPSEQDLTGTVRSAVAETVAAGGDPVLKKLRAAFRETYPFPVVELMQHAAMHFPAALPWLFAQGDADGSTKELLDVAIYAAPEAGRFLSHRMALLQEKASGDEIVDLLLCCILLSANGAMDHVEKARGLERRVMERALQMGLVAACGPAIHAVHPHVRDYRRNWNAAANLAFFKDMDQLAKKGRIATPAIQFLRVHTHDMRALAVLRDDGKDLLKAAAFLGDDDLRSFVQLKHGDEAAPIGAPLRPWFSPTAADLPDDIRQKLFDLQQTVSRRWSSADAFLTALAEAGIEMSSLAGQQDKKVLITAIADRLMTLVVTGQVSIQALTPVLGFIEEAHDVFGDRDDEWPDYETLRSIYFACEETVDILGRGSIRRALLIGVSHPPETDEERAHMIIPPFVANLMRGLCIDFLAPRHVAVDPVVAKDLASYLKSGDAISYFGPDATPAFAKVRDAILWRIAPYMMDGAPASLQQPVSPHLAAASIEYALGAHAEPDGFYAEEKPAMIRNAVRSVENAPPADLVLVQDLVREIAVDPEMLRVYKVQMDKAKRAATARAM